MLIKAEHLAIGDRVVFRPWGEGPLYPAIVVGVEDGYPQAQSDDAANMFELYEEDDIYLIEAVPYVES